MKKLALVIGLIICVAAPLFAQGPFADVPTDHWAYEAVNQLQQDGILIGYPDGTFGGKRAMTRYEFAVAVARMIPVILGKVQPGEKAGTVDLSNYVTKDQLNAALAGKADKADVDALRKLVDEFRDELAALGVDVDALKRDVAALNDRVTALEKEMARVKWNGAVDVIGTSSDLSDGPVAFDRDDRAITSPDHIRNISALENVVLDLRGSLTDTAAANVKAIAGNYLSWIGAVDDYSVFTRPDSKTTGLNTTAALYYANVDMALGNGKLTLGRQPIQWTPYTLKMIDVDSYSNISYTDSGDYPMDAARILYRFGGVKLDAFAAKNNEHELLVNGLTGQPTSGLFNDVLGVGRPLSILAGHAAGGLGTIDQSAGVRVSLGTPFQGNLGLNWMQAAGPVVANPLGVGGYDSVNVFGADLNFNIAKFLVAANWAMTDTLGTGGAADIDDNNQIIDAKIGYGLGRLGLGAGWKSIDSNFTAPGFWDKMGRWTNPVNVEGFYADANYGITSNVSIVAKAEFLEGKDTLAIAGVNPFMNDTDDQVNYYNAGLKWGLSSTNAVTLGAEFVQWQPTGGPDADEIYWNIGWGYQINPSAGFKLMYQIADTDAGPYTTTDYKGNIAVAQFGVKF